LPTRWGDVDGYATRFSEDERTNPAMAAEIAERLLAAGRAGEALAAIERAEKTHASGRSWPDWERVRIDALEALGRSDDAHEARLALFERDLSADYLRRVSSACRISRMRKPRPAPSRMRGALPIFTGRWRFWSSGPRMMLPQPMFSSGTASSTGITTGC
jgi:hypothetical protein